VSDQEFNFSQPPRREAKKAFEPPPWEQDQFEELARRKDAEKAVAEIAVSLDGPTQEASTEESKAQGPAARDVCTMEGPQGGEAAVGEAADEELRIETMMLGLRNEEPPFGTQLWKFAIAAGAVLVAVGIVIVIWGIFAVSVASRTGALGSLGGGVLVIFGLGFAGLGGWIALKTLRQQGVL
jgi:hypothetical protein